MTTNDGSGPASKIPIDRAHARLPRLRRRGWVICALASPLLASILAAQETPAPTPTPSPTPPSAAPPEPEPTPPPAPAATTSPTYFNPAIAVIGNFLAVAGNNPVENTPSFAMRESEFSFQAVVDPYAKADFFVSLSSDEIELEEGFLTFLSLPADLLVKVGQFKAQIGKVNLMHLHALPWADQPLPVVNLLGSEEGWSDAGVSVARLFPLPGDTFSELTVQVFRGEVEGLFEAPSNSDLAYLGHYRVYRDFGDDHNVEVGGTWGQGFNGTAEDAKTTLGNVHLVYRWRPLSGKPYRGIILRSELFWSQREQPEGDQDATGFFVAGDYRLGRRWFAGGRYESSDHADDASLRDEGGALTVTFWPSEFSQLRGELRRRQYAGGATADEAFLQLQFSIGTHGGHPF